MDAVGTPESVLLLGGTSEIGLAIVERLAGERPLRVVLAARPSERRDAAVERLRGHQVQVVDFDGEDVPSHASVVEQAFGSGDLDVVVVALGVLGDQEQAWQDHAAALRAVSVNYTAAVSTGVLLAARLRRQGHGAVVVLSSVAGERPRRSNFVYGSSKAGLDAFFTGLREALRPDGVRVLVVRPGFVRSRMTEGLEAAPLSTTPEAVAEAVRRALVERRDVVWVPSALRWVMSGLRHVPAPLFRRLPI
jgi:decaprenylphospho-beta-D-erythro-pentofuranosid-2-ulose 2-reductase